jgi:SAM-dependent methyltransferase
MLDQRPPGAAPAVQAHAEALPFGDSSFDAVMAILTIHHWRSVDRGLAELVRVARRRVVVVSMDLSVLMNMWLVRDYVPELMTTHARRFPSLELLLSALPGAHVTALPVARDCSDGFMAAFWGRPEAYLDARVRAATSPWYELPWETVDRGLERLRNDLASGAWDDRHGHLRNQDELDVGLRLIRGELPTAGCGSTSATVAR